MQPPLPLETNLLLASLPPASLERLRPEMSIAEYKVSERIYEAGATPDVFFPLDGIVSLIHELESGSSIEVSMVGAEGIAGLSGVLGVPNSPHMGLTQGRGLIAICSMRALRELFETDPAIRDMLLRWMHVLFAQIGQTAVCNRVHEAPVRLAHWLLMIHDRAANDEISVTHEFLALMLGSRRATISEAMTKLVESGSVDAGRKRVRILDRAKLEAQSCECYEATVGFYEAAFGFAPRAKRRATPVD